jgi:hypothetical protein
MKKGAGRRMTIQLHLKMASLGRPVRYKVIRMIADKFAA